MHKYTNSQLTSTFKIILNSLQVFIRIIRDKSKLDNLLYQTHVQTQMLKW